MSLLDKDKFKANGQVVQCTKKTNLMRLYSFGKEIIVNSKLAQDDITRKLCFMVDNIFFYNHIYFDIGSYDINSKQSLLDEYEVNVDENKQTITLTLNRGLQERIVNIYICLHKPSFKFKIYKPSLSKVKPIEYGEWSLKSKGED